MGTKNKSMYILTCFLVGNVLTGISAGISMVVLPLLMKNLNATTAQIGMIKGISGIGALAMVLPSGFLIDYYGFKKLYLLGSIISTITTIMIAFSTGIGGIIVSMSIQGFSNSFRFTALNAAFFSKLNEIGVQKSGWYRGSMTIGLTFIGPLMGGYLFKYFSYQNIFLIISIISIIPVLLIIPFDFQIAEEIVKKADVKLQKFHIKRQITELLQLLKNLDLRQTVVAEGMSTACFSSFTTFIVVYAIEILDVSSKNASFFIITEGTAYMIMVFTGGRLLFKTSKKMRYAWSIGAIITGSLLIGSNHIILLIGAGSVLLGTGVGLLNINTFSSLGNIKAQKGKVSSVLSACTGIGSTFGPMLGGVLGQIWGYGAAFLGFIPVFLLVLYFTQKGNEIITEGQSIKVVS